MDRRCTRRFRYRNVRLAKINRFQRSGIGYFTSLIARHFRQSSRGGICQRGLGELRQWLRSIKRHARFPDLHFQFHAGVQRGPFHQSAIANSPKEKRCAPRIPNHAILAGHSIHSTDGGDPHQFRGGRGAKTNRCRDRNAHAGVRTRTESDNDCVGCAKSLRAKLQILEEQTRVLSIVCEDANERLTVILEPGDASLPAGKFERENFHFVLVASVKPSACSSRRRPLSGRRSVTQQDATRIS